MAALVLLRQVLWAHHLRLLVCALLPHFQFSLFSWPNLAATLDPQPPSHSLLTSRCQGNFLQSIYLSSSNCSFFVLLNSSQCPGGKYTFQYPLPQTLTLQFLGTRLTLTLPHAYLLKGLCCAPGYFLHSFIQLPGNKLRITLVTYIHKVSLIVLLLAPFPCSFPFPVSLLLPFDSVW